MKNSAIRKDFYMEIKNTLNRFMSIFLIVALGVAFFSGIRATNPDMRLTADRYFDVSEMMDIRVMSTWGITMKEVEAINRVEGVLETEPFYTTHVVCDANGNELVLEVISATEKLNKITVSDGRMPEEPDEVLVDPFFIESSGYQIGDSIQIDTIKDASPDQILHETLFTITGVGTTSYYLSFQRGISGIGSGDVDSFIVVRPEVFVNDVYSGLNVTVQGARTLTAFTDPYDNKVREVIDNIKQIAEEQTNQRYEEQYSQAIIGISKAKDDLDIAKKEVEAKIDAMKASLDMLPPNHPQRTYIEVEITEAKGKAEIEFTEAKEEIKASENQLAILEPPSWYVLDRSSIEAYVEYEQNADRIGAIGKVFPAIFFFIAAMISLTTMTRMVEEERIQIGTLKALGYTKKTIAMKYLLYALLATFGGSVAGALLGTKLLPNIIIKAYMILYPNLPKVVAPFHLSYSVIATFFAVLSVGSATFLACYRVLKAKPAELMRPASPKMGKSVLLEKIPFLWRLLSFSWKATIRNLFRYKKRSFMTIFGISGCMALLLVGFGLKDSIFAIYTKQFDEIIHYDISVSLNKNTVENEIEAVKQEIIENTNVKDFVEIYELTTEVSKNKIVKSVQLIVPKQIDKIDDFIVFRNRTTQKAYQLNENDIILSEQIANQIGAKAGDRIAIKNENKTEMVKVAEVTENYMMHYIYMSPVLYEKIYGRKPDYNQIYLLLGNEEKEIEQQVGNSLLNNPAVKGVFYISYFRNLLSNMLVSLNIVVGVLIVAAGALAFIVLYNLNNININERRRELATIKVLGFYNNELTAYVYRENIILTIFGAGVGVGLGILLHRYVIETVEINMVMFGRIINPESYIYSILLTFFFSAFVNFTMMFKLKNINMVESLKSVE